MLGPFGCSRSSNWDRKVLAAKKGLATLVVLVGYAGVARPKHISQYVFIDRLIQTLATINKSAK